MKEKNITSRMQIYEFSPKFVSQLTEITFRKPGVNALSRLK